MTLSPGEMNAAMRRLRDGDRAAARVLFDGLWPVVRRFCARSLGEASADDTAQRTLIKVFHDASEYDVTRDVFPWAMEIAVWECRTERQRLRRSREDASSDAGHETEDGRDSPVEAFERKELIAALEEALDELSATDRSVLMETILSPRSSAIDATGRKRKQRATARLRNIWRTLHGD